MKIIKYVLLLIFLFSIAVTVFVATQDGKYIIKKEKVISVPQPLLFDFINDYRNWENVDILNDNDTTAIFAYSQRTAGTGAITTWRLDDTNGRIKTVRTTENDSIIQRAVIDGLSSDVAWGFEKINGGTKVTVSIKGELSFTEKANAAFKGGVTEKLEKRLEKGLNELNKFLTHELTTYNINVKGPVKKLGTYYLSQTASSTIPEMNRRVTEILPNLRAFIKENKIETNGKPFTIYQSYDKVNNKTSFKVCIPIKEEIFTAPGSEVEGGRLQPFEAYKTTLRGYYSHLPKAWTKAHDTIAARGIQENTSGQYIEVYTRNVSDTKKPSQWLTDIYVPIGPESVPATTIEGEEQAATSANRTQGTTTSTTKALPASTKPATAPVRPAGTNNTRGTNNSNNTKPADSNSAQPRTPVTGTQSNTEQVNQ